jgi:hypothetical protein
MTSPSVVPVQVPVLKEQHDAVVNDKSAVSDSSTVITEKVLETPQKVSDTTVSSMTTNQVDDVTVIDVAKIEVTTVQPEAKHHELHIHDIVSTLSEFDVKSEKNVRTVEITSDSPVVDCDIDFDMIDDNISQDTQIPESLMIDVSKATKKRRRLAESRGIKHR